MADAARCRACSDDRWGIRAAYRAGRTHRASGRGAGASAPADSGDVRALVGRAENGDHLGADRAGQVHGARIVRHHRVRRGSMPASVGRSLFPQKSIRRLMPRAGLRQPRASISSQAARSAFAPTITHAPAALVDDQARRARQTARAATAWRGRRRRRARTRRTAHRDRGRSRAAAAAPGRVSGRHRGVRRTRARCPSAVVSAW